MKIQKKGKPPAPPFFWNFEYPSPRSLATKIIPIKIRIRPFPSTLATSCASYTSMRRSLSVFPNLLYILLTVFLILRLSLPGSADYPFLRSVFYCTSCCSFANPLACPLVRPWFARPCKLQILCRLSLPSIP